MTFNDDDFFLKPDLHIGLVKKEYFLIIMGYFFLFLHKNICCGYSLEAPQLGTSNEYPQHTFLYGELEKIIPQLSPNTSS